MAHLGLTSTLLRCAREQIAKGRLPKRAAQVCTNQRSIFSPSTCWPLHPTYRQLFRNRSCLSLAPSVSRLLLRCRQPPRVVSRQDANPARVLCSLRPVSERLQAQCSATEGGT